MESRKLKRQLDVQKFKTLPSCEWALCNGSGSFCAQGKLMAASGVDDKNELDFALICKDVLWENNSYQPQKLREVAALNNTGKFVEADALALEWAVESGKFELVNCVKEQEAEVTVNA